jgi:DNA-binding transcriptional MerR regulator
MLTPAYGRGPSATYDKDHMLRLRMIEELKDQHLQLREIKAKLQKLSLEDLEAHFSITSGPNEAMWKRISIHSDVELHVQVHDERDYAFDSAIQQIVQYARFVLDQGEETT